MGPQVKMDLTDRELDVLKLAQAGLSNTEIAKALNISANTVKAHRQRILQKLMVGSIKDAI